MGTLIAMLVPLIPTIVTGIESLFGKGAGAQKMATATQTVQAIVDALIKSGALPADTSSLASSIPTVIEYVVQLLKSQGQLGGSGAAPVAAVPSQPLPAGSTALGTLTFGRGALYGVTQIPIQGS